jgi:CheY-like chemotaxis protein
MDEQFLAKLDNAAGTVLIVDSTGADVATLQRPLADDGYGVVTAKSEADALHAISQAPPDLIIAPMNLTNGSGVTLCQTLKKSASTAHIPIVLIGDKGEDARAAESLRAGADEFLTKPIDLEILFLKIGRLIVDRPESTAQEGVSGSLRDMGFSDMIQILCAGGKSMRISFVRGEDGGEVCIENGDIVYACAGEIQGEDAFYDLMRWREGDFTASECGSFDERNVQAPLMSLLMEGARLADEQAETEG